MSTHIEITKKPSGHNLLVSVINPGTKPQQFVLQDGESREVMIHGDGAVGLQEIPKPSIQPTEDAK